MKVVDQLKGLSESEYLVSKVTRKKLEAMVFKYRCDIKELKKIIMTPRLHEKYVFAVNQRRMLTERG